MSIEYKEPRWLQYARTLVGTREILGPRHSSKIMAMVRRAARFLGINVDSDEVPWCGTFLADVIWTGAGIQPPPLAVRAKSWAKWGVPCEPVVGAIAVFERRDGGHVGIVTGETDTHLRILGGNQANAVNEMLISKSRLIACRWPYGEPRRTRRKYIVAESDPVFENES